MPQPASLTSNHQVHELSYYQRNANSLYTALVVSGLVLGVLATLGQLGVISFYYSSGTLILGCMGATLIFGGALGALIHHCKKQPTTSNVGAEGTQIIEPRSSGETSETLSPNEETPSEIPTSPIEEVTPSQMPASLAPTPSQREGIDTMIEVLSQRGVLRRLDHGGVSGIQSREITSNLQREFSEIPKVQGVQIVYTDGKDRYRNVLPYIVNAVGEPYVNASRLTHYPGAHILAQGPLSTTLNDFWRMIWDSDIESIFVVSKTREGISKKFEKYWPQNGKFKQYGSIGVFCVKKTTNEGIIKRTLILTQGEKRRKIIQYHSKVWGDHQVLPIQDLHQLVLEMEKYTKVLSHCSAGIGRSGTLVTAYLLKQLHDEVKSRGESWSVELSKFVEFQRMPPHGRPGMIQAGQYAMLYQYLRLLNQSE